MIHGYPRARRVAWLATDLLLIFVFVWHLLVPMQGRLGPLLAYAAPLLVAWNVLTLHYPRVIGTDERGVRFEAYGRSHRYEWPSIERVHVRRFLVRDRVLVRILPSPPWRGRYWILSTIEGYEQLVRELESWESRQSTVDSRES